jgi:cell wall-associated NlpC family hydrolase
MAGAGLVSAALVGVFALPAYASSVGTVGSSEEAEAVYAQALTTSSLPDIEVPAELPSAEEQPVVEVEVPATEEGVVATGYDALPAGSGSSGIVAAALAQLGMDKDCTDVAQDALAAVGIVTSRYEGGPDLGVQSFAQFGTVYAFSTDGLAPGDLLVYPGIPHVAIYIGNGQVVHGGWHPTALASYMSNGVYPDYVVRVV